MSLIANFERLLKASKINFVHDHLLEGGMASNLSLKGFETHVTLD